MKWGVVVFPGSNCDRDCFHALYDVLKQDVVYLWHKDKDLKGVDAVVLPGGFSYGDYLRVGAMARFAPIMDEVVHFAKQGGPVIGICNGFQILVEAGLLPGALMRNKTLKFMCQDVFVKCETKGPWTRKFKSGKILKMPIAHGDGQYFVRDNQLKELQTHDQIALRYCSAQGDVEEKYNPNGSILNIAGVYNKKKNVLGLMPHPERASEDLLGSSDGQGIFESVL